MSHRRLLKGVVWLGVTMLVAVGIFAGVARSLYLDDLITRIEPVRTRALVAAGLHDPLAAMRASELEAADGRFARHHGATLLHVLSGVIFLILAPLQFSSRIRRRFVAFHRWSGRLLVLVGSVTAVAGMYFGLAMPYAGPGEAAVVALFGGLFLFAIARAFIAIRRREIERHRAWMIRAFALAMGVSTVRLVAIPLDFMLTPSAVTPRTIFVLSLFIGWAISAAAAEWWLAYTRRRAVTPRPASVAAV